MLSSSFTLSDIVAIGSVIGVIIALFNLLVHVGDRMWGKKGADKPNQSEGCRNDHNNLHAILVQQNSNNCELIKALRDHIHAEELRHQIVISKLDRIADVIRGE